MSKYVDGVNEKNMDAFLAALRSGDYRQGKSALCDIHRDLNDQPYRTYCCLGVGSELTHQAGVITSSVSVLGRSVSYGGKHSLPPVEVLDWLGIPEANRLKVIEGEFNIVFTNSGLEHRYDDRVTATEMNDGREMSFQEIADVFEKEFTKED